MAHYMTQVIMTIVTIFALFGDDFRLLAFGIGSDNYFVNLTVASMCLFTIEIILCSIGQEEYLNSFFFWLDLLSTVSLITDIPPLMEKITGGSQDLQETDTTTLIRASRGARIGTRAGRLTRIIRIIKLIRVVKLYKRANQAFQDENEKEKRLANSQGNRRGILSDDEEPEKITLKDLLHREQQKESKVGKRLSDITTRRTVILVLAMLFSTPILSVGSYLDQPESLSHGLNLVRTLGGPSTVSGKSAFYDTIKIQKDLKSPIVYMHAIDSLGNLTWI